MEKEKKSSLPSKLKHIKNQLYLKNSWDPIKEKYVKRIWAHKLMKISKKKMIKFVDSGKTPVQKEKRDQIWTYFRHRGKASITETLLKTYYKNVKDVTIIYFDDPVQYRFVVTDEMVKQLREHLPEKVEKIPNHPKYIENKIYLKNATDPFNNKYVKIIWVHKKTKRGKNKRNKIWQFKHCDKKSVINALLATYHKNIRDVTITYFDANQHRFIIDDKMVKQLK